MVWDKDLFEDQKEIASHFGCHALLIAGPGTGKTLTLTRRVLYLIEEQKISPNQILVITFTRAATAELRNRVFDSLSHSFQELPRICTLHSFALRQILLNSKMTEILPQPIRIADKWETRNIIFEDLKGILNFETSEIRYTISDIEENFNLLSTDWQTLNAEQEDWEKNFRDPRFLAAWRHHRETYGYTLLSELVYQLKRGLTQYEDFALESDYLHLLIDEYQDLNKCDLAVISALKDKECEIFASGDDDQSIYGFRFAHPEGIRRFKNNFTPSNEYNLKKCIRCDRKIIELATFVAALDEHRIKKPLECLDNAKDGEVNILRFSDQDHEAEGVSLICDFLINKENYKPGDILILLRSDRYRVFSSILENFLKEKNIPVETQITSSPLDIKEGRMLLSFLNLLIDPNDNLAIRTLLILRDTKIGSAISSQIYMLARKKNFTFSEAIYKIMDKPSLISRFGKRISIEMQKIQEILNKHKSEFDSLNDSSTPIDLKKAIRTLSQDVIFDTDKLNEIHSFLDTIIDETLLNSHKDLITTLNSPLEDKEQEICEDKVNIITMHKAKGLTAKGVIIVGAEDEYIPGKSEGELEGDERRLLYVSLSRAKHYLALTYCNRRTGYQRYTGRTSGQLRRNLTRFLVDCSIDPIDGMKYAQQLN